MDTLPSTTLDGIPLRLEYVRVRDIVLWDKNPKKHSLDAIIGSIKRHGFRDPSAYDATLNGLVEGNGRAEALSLMQKNRFMPPAGIMIEKSTGEWCMPVIFGLDSPSKLAAELYAVDHNNITMAGGDFTAFDLAKMWETEGHKKLLEGFQKAGETLFSLDADDIGLLLNASPLVVDADGNVTANDEGPGDDITLGQIIIRYNSTRHENVIFNTIQGIIEDNPEWGAKIINSGK